MAKTLKMPVAIKDVDGINPSVPTDDVEEFEEFDDDDFGGFTELEEIEDYATPGGSSAEDALEKVQQARAGGMTDPIQDFRLLPQEIQLKGMTGVTPEVDHEFEEIEGYATPGGTSAEEALEKVQQARAGGMKDPIQDFRLMQQEMQLKGMVEGDTLKADNEFETLDDYETPGGLTQEEALAGAKQFMRSASTMEEYGRYAAQAAVLERGQTDPGMVKASENEAIFNEYTTPLGGPEPASKTLKSPTFGGLKSPLELMPGKHLDEFKQAISKKLNDVQKNEPAPEVDTTLQNTVNPKSKDLEKPAVEAPAKQEKPAPEKRSEGRALPDLSGLKTSRGTRALEF